MKTAMVGVLLVISCSVHGTLLARDQAKKQDSQAKAGPPGQSTDVGTDPTKTSGDKAAGPGGKVPAVDRTYIIGPEDILRVIVWGQGQIPGDHIVRPDGMISVPLAGEVLADGMTCEQLEKSIAERLKDSKLILDPKVTVQILGVHSKKIFISGEVNHPGSVDLVVPTRVSEALSGGFRDFAKRTKVRIIHRDGTTSIYNDKEVSRGKHLEQDIFLKPGDHIYVD